MKIQNTPTYSVGISTFGEGIYGIHIREDFLLIEGALRVMTAAEMQRLTVIGNSHNSLVEALDDAISGLEVARTALSTAESCMGNHEMQDSKYNNARHLIYTAKIAAHATSERLCAAIAKATGGAQ